MKNLLLFSLLFLAACSSSIPQAPVDKHESRWTLQYNTVTGQYLLVDHDAVNRRWGYDFEAEYYLKSLGEVDSLVSETVREENLMKQYREHEALVKISWRTIYPTNFAIPGLPIWQPPQER